MQNISFFPLMSLRRPHIAEFRRGGGDDILPVVRERDEIVEELGGIRLPDLQMEADAGEHVDLLGLRLP